MAKATTEYVGGPTRSRVLELKRRGLKGTQIAKVLDITPQRVYQHLAALRKRGVLPEEKAS
jgi:predicted ArsR family transcriptional regulator